MQCRSLLSSVLELENVYVTKLVLGGNMLDDAGCSTLVLGLRNLEHLRHLDLSSNSKLTWRSCAALGELVATHQKVRVSLPALLGLSPRKKRKHEFCSCSLTSGGLGVATGHSAAEAHRGGRAQAAAPRSQRESHRRQRNGVVGRPVEAESFLEEAHSVLLRHLQGEHSPLVFMNR